MTRFDMKRRLTGGSEANSVNKWFGGGFAAAATAFESIATATGTGASGTITFSSIPATFTHLQIRYLNTPSSATYFRVTVNGITGTSYAWHALVGNGSNPVQATGGASAGETYTLGFFSNIGTTYPNASIIDILDYASTTKNKTFRFFSGYDANGTGEIAVASGLFNSTNAITSVSIQTGSGNFATSSTFALYGIKAAA